MKKRIKIIEILLLLAIVISIFIVRSTYSKYIEGLTTPSETNIKRWLIKVNNSDIREEGFSLSNVLTPNIVPISYESEVHSSNDVLVPGSKLYFEIIIDYSQVDVSFDFSYDVSSLNDDFKDFKIIGYKEVVDDIEGDLKELNTDPITINDPNEGTSKTFRIYAEWNDNEENQMSDSEDTDFSRNNTELEYKVKLTFIQHVEENQENNSNPEQEETPNVNEI